MVCLCSWKTYKICHLQQVIFSFCKFLTTPIVVKYTYTVLNKLSWIGKSHESDLCCYIKVFHVLHGSTKGTTRIVLSVTDHQENKKFIKWFRYHFYILFGVICFFFVFEYSIFWIYLYIVTDTADFLQSNIIHIKLEINNVCLLQSFILELHYKNKSTKSFELPNITEKVLNFRFEMCKKCIFHTLVNIFLNSSNWALQF